MRTRRDDQAAEPSDKVTEPSDTHSRILHTSLELFSTQGYQRTSLRQIAGRLGITKAAVLYHFPTKDSILGALIRPLLEDLEDVVERAAALHASVARWTLVEGILDAFIKHRPALLMLRYDLSILSYNAEDYERFFTVIMRGNQVIAGSAADLPDRVLATQAIAMIGDPVFLFPEVPAEELRPMILDGIRRLFGARPVGASADQPGDGVAKPAGRGARRTGRPNALDDERLATAQRMYATGKYSVTRLAAELGVSRATLYRHLDRGVATEIG